MALIPSRRRKGFGLRFEDGPINTFGLERLRLELNTIPPAFTHEGDIPTVPGGIERFIFDQQATSSCVSNTFLHGVILKESREGFDFDEPSRLFPYWNSRKENGHQWFDGGTYLRSMGIALRKHGCPSERYWKWSQLGIKVNRRPNWRATRHAHPRRGGKYVRIYETGTDRIQAIQQALMNGHDVGFGTRVYDSFLASNGPLLVDKPTLADGNIAGNHAMLIIGWAHFGGKLYFRVLNSWGSGYRDGGLLWMSAEYIAWVQTRDLHIIYGWERLQ